MQALNLTAADLAGLFLRLLPRGKIWPKALSAVQAESVAALMPTYERLVARDNNLLIDAFPTTTVELLPEWESTLGLPDPCAGEDQTIAQRQVHVVARLTQQDGPSIASLTAFVAALGYTITIQEFAPARFGRAKFGDRMNGVAWAFAWQITAPATPIVPAYFGTARFGDPFRSWQSTVLECEMQRIKPAHTILLFAYTGPAPAGLWDTGPGWDHGAWSA